MPQVIIARAAASGIDRCRAFLAEKNPDAAERAAVAIAAGLRSLRTTPEIGRPHPEDAEFRELLIRFGSAGYVALYRHDKTRDAVVVVAVKHMREARYRGV